MKITDPRPSARQSDVLTVPNTPQSAGLMVRAMRRSGAHYSSGNQRPAAVAPVVSFSGAEHGRLNDDGVCITRYVEGVGLRLYGDRTLAHAVKDGRQFGNVRRWLNYTKRSINGSMQDFPFRPAHEETMEDVEFAVGDFLFKEWHKGALFPRDNQGEAFLVQCDEETTTDADLADGKLNCMVKVSPTTPAEQINFIIQPSVGGVSISEG